MAFDRADTDQLYEKMIRPLLASLGVTPVIINRTESNEDLNAQIIAQLDRCDFCVADLTYARPSVYFEAGFAERLVPVIYTVRADHLNSGAPDDQRVHFDLQMKPLVKWRSPGDLTFRSRLERRLNHTFLRQWRAEQRQDAATAAATAKFRAKPPLNRSSVLKRVAVKTLRGYGFSLVEHRHVRSARHLTVASAFDEALVMIRPSRVAPSAATVQCPQRLNGEHLELLRSLAFPRAFSQHLGTSRSGLRSISVVNVVMPLQRLPPARIEQWFPLLSPSPSRRAFTRDFLADLNALGPSRHVPCRHALVSLPQATFPEALREGLRAELDRVLLADPAT